MNNLEFLSFIKTPAEKHLGIAAIRVDKRFIFRFKIQQNPKGEGYFTNAPSIKIDDAYFAAFQFDSSYEADEVRKFVLSNVKQALHASPPSNSIFSPSPASAPPIQETFNFEQTPF